MSLTVDTLNKSIISGSSLIDIIKEQLLIIDKQIMRSDKSMGGNTLVYDLPVMFPSLPTDPASSKKIVYSRIIQSLEKRGFVCSIRLTKGGEKVQLVIKWNIGVDIHELEELDSFLKSRVEKT